MKVKDPSELGMVNRYSPPQLVATARDVIVSSHCFNSAYGRALYTV